MYSFDRFEVNVDLCQVKNRYNRRKSDDYIIQMEKPLWTRIVSKKDQQSPHRTPLSGIQLDPPSCFLKGPSKALSMSWSEKAQTADAERLFGGVVKAA